MIAISKPQLILLDIEGTTSSISFVKQCLFPYIEINLKQYLLKNWNENHLREDIDLLRKQSQTDFKSGLREVPVITEDQTNDEVFVQSVIDNVLWQMSADRKTTALKQFQGNVWRFGYQNGEIKGHVYSDVPKAMTKWKQELDIKLCIYSSGSVLAQRLLFSHSLFGDLTHLIDNYFDTTIGPKTESLSYTKIAEKCGLNPNQILFLTDVAKEAIAAKNVGINALISIREGTESLSPQVLTQFSTIKSFLEIEFK